MDTDQCAEAFSDSLTINLVITLFAYSAVVLILYSLLQRRTKLCRDCCFGGYCGLPLPINFINETKDRWVYCAIFGMLANLFSYVVTQVSTGTASSFGDAIQSAIVLFISMIILPLYFFALIASIHGPLQPLSHLIGLIYAVVSFYAYVRPCAICMHYANSEPRGIEFLGTSAASQIVSCAPLLLCSGIVVMYFAIKGTYVLILRLLRRPLPKQENIDHCLGYVRRLFHDPQTDSTNSFANKYCYKWDPYFKYSVRLLSVFTVIFISLLVLSVQTAFTTASGLYGLKDTVIHNTKVKWTDVLESVHKLLLVIAFILPLISFAMVIIPLIFSLATYRQNCKQLWRGDRSFITRLKQSPAALLTSSAFLFGRQLAMAIWAWTFYMVILFIVVSILAGLITLMVFVDAIRSYVLHYIYFAILTFGLGVIIYFCQFSFVYFAFADRSVLVDNRRLFHFYTFFFLLYNSISGLVTTLRRIFISFVVALFFLPRLDRPLVVGGLEFLDKGYASYLAYIQVEAAYTNPVLNVFIHLLMAQVKAKYGHFSYTSSFTRISNTDDTKVRHYGSTPLMSSENLISDNNNAARKRWHLAYTLVRNPELIKLRKGFISSTNDATSL